MHTWADYGCDGVAAVVLLSVGVNHCTESDSVSNAGCSLNKFSLFFSTHCPFEDKMHGIASVLTCQKGLNF